MLSKILASKTIHRAIRRWTRFYCGDGLLCSHQSAFMNDDRFRESYAYACRVTGQDYDNHWRLRVAIWAAEHALKAPGDFVECGVNYGFTSAAIARYLHPVCPRFWLVDDFRGSPEGFFNSNPERLRDRHPHERLIVGTIPGVLRSVKTEGISFLHLDLNDGEAELAALNYFRPRLLPSSIVLMDDYNYVGFERSRLTMDKSGLNILPLPTGQGLAVRYG